MYGIFILISLIGLAGVSFTLITKKEGFRYCMHITWCFYSLFMIIAFALSIILFRNIFLFIKNLAISNILMDGCIYTSNTLND